MPENEFEKKVSSEMQELKFSPSEKVWLQVEERIRRKKKRKVFILFFLLAGLALLGYWQWNNFFGERKNEVVKVEQSVDQKNNTEVGTVTGTESEKDKPANKEPDKTSTNINNKQRAQSINKEPLNEPASSLPGKIYISNSKENSDPQKKNITDKSIRKPKLGIARPNNREPVLNKNDVTLLEKKEPKVVKDSIEIKYTGVDTITQSIDRNDIKAEDNKMDSVKINAPIKNEDDKKDSAIKKLDSVSKIISPTDSPIVKLPIKPFNKKWGFGIEFTPGISSLNESLFSFNMNKSADAYANPAQSGNAGGFPTIPAAPSPSRSGFGFQIGGFAKKEMSVRGSFSIGIRYSYYSEKINIGRDTVLNILFQSYTANSRPYFRASNSFRDKTNGYHFIEIPVAYHLRLNKNKNKPFTWNAGLTISRLIATNAVMYDTAFGGIYYKNKKWLNKTQFSLTTGFSLTLGNNKNIQWSIGPAIDIHLNSLLDDPYQDKKYLFFGGLRSSILFKQKK